MRKPKPASRSRIVHRAVVVDNEAGIKKLGYRWQCSCRRSGTWTFDTVEAERNGRRHETRGNAKQASPGDFSALRELLRLD